jgi:hemolysin activation/secretion protein
LLPIEVTVKASNPYKISAFANNYQNPSVGAEQYGVDFFASNPTTLGDKLRLSYSQSEASRLVSASYSLPILKDDTRIEASISHGRNKVITSLLKDLDIKNQSTDWRIGINHPIINKASPDSRFKFGIGLSFDRRKTKESLLGFDFPISAGSDNNGRRNINTLTVSQNLLYRGKNQALHLESGLDIGLDSLTGPGYANNQALSFHLEHEYVHKLPWNTFFIANGGFQFAPSPLVVDRQISLGGIGSVRGVQQDITNNDNGIYEQVSFKKEFELGRYGIFSTAPFFDIGFGWNSTKDDNSSKLIFSSGIALEYTFHDNISANITLAMPLSENIGNIQILAGVKIQF